MKSIVSHYFVQKHFFASLSTVINQLTGEKFSEKEVLHTLHLCIAISVMLVTSTHFWLCLLSLFWCVVLIWRGEYCK